MMIRFDEYEYMIMAMFEKENRQQTMAEIRNIIPFVKEDEEILSLVNDTLGKMEKISDQEFQALDLDFYSQEPLEDD